MPAEESKAVIRRFYERPEEYWRTGNVDLFDEVVSPSVVHHGPGLPSDMAGLKQVLPMFRAAFPDMRVTFEEMIAEGDVVTDRITVHATHQGEMMGIPASGRRVRFTEIHTARVEGGKIVERWSEWDQLGLLQQIGAIPSPAGSRS
uniref:Ester cyclase n=1 Tax=Thermorudis peleae TaxID=1382356 RepID=A0A831WZJ6_9BACT